MLQFVALYIFLLEKKIHLFLSQIFNYIIP